MNSFLKGIYYLICIILIFSFIGCSEQKEQLSSLALEHNSQQSSVENNNLDTWIGEYEFNEFSSPNINMDYKINIYKENNEYFAKIFVDGFQTTTRVQAKVLGDEESIELDFQMYLPDNSFELFNNSDIILRFKKENSNIYTYWGKMEPVLPENKSSGNIYFKKI